jgi:endo-1,4-beta-xylanase
MLTRRAIVGPLAAGGAAAAFGARALSPAMERDGPTGPALGTVASARGILYGSATSTFQLRDADFAGVLAREARILVAEYEMKRSTIQPQAGSYNFAPADALLRFANDHRMAMRGHTLVWHKSNPPWLGDALQSPRKEAFLTGYIETIAARYRGQMHSWDVVNEALAPGGGRSDGLRDTLWLKAFGPSYIDLAFHAARSADPGALLVYNDEGCEGGFAEHERFRAVTLDFLEGAIARGVPIGAYGMQGHLQAFGPKIDQAKLREFLARLKALGLRILVTEHDVDDSGGTLDVAARDRAVADASRRFLDVVLDSDAALAVLTWGLSDRFLDFPGMRAAMMGYSPRTLPLDAALARKPMWQTMAGVFGSARHRLTAD